jgi:amino acid adenylation domain-containing protein
MANEPIHEMVRRSAERFGDHLAVDAADHRMTYRQLVDRAGELAAALRRSGAAPGSLVAIVADRVGDVIAAMLGTLEAGCAFVPLDFGFPVATLPAVIAEVEPRFWLVGPEHEDAFRELRRTFGFEVTVLPLAPLDTRGDGVVPAGAATAAIVPPRDPEGLCYVYFTSGSTGRPKGIAGRLKAIDHFIRWEIEALGIGPGTRVSQFTSPAFDAFLRDAFVPLAAGGTVCVPGGREVLLDGRRLAAWIEEQRIELLHCTPSLFRSLLALDLDARRFQALRHVLLAGEPLLPSDVRRWHDVFGDRIEMINLYGPSETTMVKFFYRVRPEDGGAQFVPIGQPMPGARAIVVDDKGQVCRPNKVGEIYIRTPYRSLGYLNQPQLTGEVFIQNPWSDRPDDIVYKTGDLGRMREDGNFEILGRRDQQVKVRGVRIEVAPIEDLLRDHPQVAEAVVSARDDVQGNKFLCAYVVAKGQLESSRLGEFLRARLPEAMIPSVFVEMEALPRILSGKVNRQGLPDPGGLLRREYVAPRTPVEEELCGIFSELLAVPRIGIRDSFFALGGHSLSATLLLSRMRAKLGVEVPLREVFRRPTVEEIALAVTRLQGEQEDAAETAALDAPIVPVPRGGPLPLSFAQQRLWFIDQLEPGSPLYNIPVALRVGGPLDSRVLALCLGEIVRRHESLRTVFALREGAPVQEVQEAVPGVLPVVDLAGLPESRREAEAQSLAGEEAGRPFDLARGPLLRGVLLRLAGRLDGRLDGEDHVVSLSVHHIASDGWSMGILVREVLALYAALSAGRPSPLAELPVQYADFALWQRQRLPGEALDELGSYWLRRLAGAPPLLRLATDRSRPARQSYRGARLEASFPAELGRRVAGLADREGCTTFMTLLGAFAVLLRHSAGQEDLVVGAPFGARHWPEIEGLIGLFVNPLPLRLDLSGDPTFRQVLAGVRQGVIEALRHQHMPFDRLVEKLQPERDLGHNPLFQVTFNLIEGDLAEPVALPGLEVADFPFASESTQFDLSLTVSRQGPDLKATFLYSTDLFDALTVGWMGEDLRQVLDEVTAEPETPLRHLGEILRAAETKRRAALAAAVKSAQRESFSLRRRQAVAVLEEALNE